MLNAEGVASGTRERSGNVQCSMKEGQRPFHNALTFCTFHFCNIIFRYCNITFAYDNRVICYFCTKINSMFNN